MKKQVLCCIISLVKFTQKPIHFDKKLTKINKKQGRYVMNNSERRLLRITDVLIITVVAVVGLALFFGGKTGNGNPVAVITVDGEETRRIDLTSAENEIITLNTLPEVTLEIKDSKIRFVNSLCPDKTCEKSGFLSEVGDTAACVPAKTVVTITGDGNSSDIDAVAG